MARLTAVQPFAGPFSEGPVRPTIESEEPDMSLAKTQSVAEIKARNKELIQEVLAVYPEKTAKRRAKHLNVHEAASPIAASSRTSSPFPA